MNILRNIPKLDEFLLDERITYFKAYMSNNKLIAVLRDEIALERTNLKNIQEDNGQNSINIERSGLYEKILKKSITRLNYEIEESLKRVINATGVVIHTNLGRAPISMKAASHVFNIATGYSNLEYSTVHGERRSRLYNIEKILVDLTGAESAIVVNNNAAAVFLVLNTLCNGKEVVLSRGEIVEIGDSFRINEIIENSGCRIKEVGTTNKTTIKDYSQAICEQTSILLKVHTSNFKVVGFTETVESKELSHLGKESNIPVMEDMGSGILIDLSKFGLKYERQVADAVKDDVDIITFSGDKMLGGSQAGIIAGKRKYIDLIRKNQLLRCLRMDKLGLAALEATLFQYFEPNPDIPILQKLIMPLSDIKKNAEILCSMLNELQSFKCRVWLHEAQFGGGSMPGERLDSYAVYIKSTKFSSNEIDKYFRNLKLPIIATVQKDEVLLDVRTIDTTDFNYIKETLLAI